MRPPVISNGAGRTVLLWTWFYPVTSSSQMMTMPVHPLGPRNRSGDPRPALDSSEAGPGPRINGGKTPPPPQAGPGSGRAASSQSVISQWSTDRILRKSLLAPQLTGQPLGRCPQTSTHQAEESEASAPRRSPGWEADGALKRGRWTEEHRKLSFPPLPQVLPQACSTQSGPEGGSSHAHFRTSEPASHLTSVTMAPSVVMRTDAGSGR
jgi:hypothetical protein